MHPFPMGVALVLLLAIVLACVIGLCMAVRVALDAPYWDIRLRVGMYIAALLCAAGGIWATWAIVFLTGVKL